jgi:AraC-like DNA-binding protein
MDVLADILSHAGVTSTLGARIAAGADWGWWAEPATTAAFHAVTSGTAWLAAEGDAEPRQLLPGDLVLLPTGRAHALGGDPAAVARAAAGAPNGYERADDGAVLIGSGPARTHILCAHYDRDPVVETDVLGVLPDVVHVHAAGDGALGDIVRLLGRELAEPQLASELVLNRLVDVLLVQLLRAWVADADGEDALPSWLGALRDPLVGRAVAHIHEDPARPWTTATLADAIAVSRATLSRRFPAAVGETPGAYLARWRMDLAASRLAHTDQPLEVIAESVGYTSVHAFNRAFRRARGTPPGRFRATAAR